MSYVDMMGNTRWSDDDHFRWSESYVDSAIPHRKEHVLVRRMISMIIHLMLLPLPDSDPMKQVFNPLATSLSTEQMVEVLEAAAIFLQAETVQEQGRADAALLHHALDSESAQARLALALDETNPNDAAERSAAQAVIDAASAVSGVQQLLSDRQTWRTSHQ